MKKIIFFALMLIISAGTFSQQTSASPGLTKQDYLKKRFHQNTAAHLMLWCGLVTTCVGGVIQMNGNYETDPLFDLIAVRSDKKYNHTGDIISFTGLASMLGSIPLFIAAAKNKRKAMSLSFKKETAPQIQKNSFVYRPVPSLTLKISL